ncbi:hypothetical protein HYH02_001416 [Chlamydomonas schloesseri]|uniref:Kazal-like domain-containing protein n=1 Tax=Chlamydomonas schloesseri TaxID=2026947 RepID=A0A835WUA9_9CHLO|nr:hypothetical protein HYH02_001416 [Chlamydomonas schloesseri]|eukprot:KAG2454393.1 hypothetical protein HYH02_001416 [Chlamydomonas schloesseri]
MCGVGQQRRVRAPAVVLALVAFIALYAGNVAATEDPKPDDGCVCPAMWAPVCGADGKTYGNACEAACAGKAVSYQGPCADPSGCAAVLCIQEDAPVCGNNNVTYPNKCMAGCTGVYIQYNGKCGDPVKPISDDVFPTCPPAGPAVQCLVDPCIIVRSAGSASSAVSASRAVCPSAPGAVCHSNYCAAAVYRGTPLGPCAAVWLDSVSGDIVECKGGATDGGSDGGSNGVIGGEGLIVGEDEGGAISGSSGNSGSDAGGVVPQPLLPGTAGGSKTSSNDGGNNAAKGGKTDAKKPSTKKPSTKSSMPPPGGRRNGPSPSTAGGPKVNAKP